MELWRMAAKGVLLGLSIAAPVGPVGALCIRRTLVDGRLAGLASGLGAATADALYGAVAGCGLSTISQALLAGRFWIGLVGGGFLVWLGLRTLVARPALAGTPAPGGGPAAAFMSTLALTLANPMTILSFVAIFAGLDAGRFPGLSTGYARVGVLVAGVFAGSAAWWLLLSFAVASLRCGVTPRMLRWVNVGSGLTLLGFGVRALVAAGR